VIIPTVITISAVPLMPLRDVSLGESVISSTAQPSREATSDRVALSCRQLPVSGWRVGFVDPHDQLRVIVWRFDREQQHLAACLSTAESPTRAQITFASVRMCVCEHQAQCDALL
jgi:hypothetical protein